MEYNHVAVDAWGINEGVDEPFGTIVAGVAQDHSFTADITANQLIQDKTKLNVVVFLIDKKTKKIVNAAKTAINPYDPDAFKQYLGDVNLDEKIDITDAMCIVDLILSKPLNVFAAINADLNGDGVIDITDAMKIVDIILNRQP